MPAVTLEFRAVCGSFLAVFLNFMLKRTRELVAMRFRSLTLRYRSTGVLVGLLLSLLCHGDLLYRAYHMDRLYRSGDTEKNPGPTTLRQSKLNAAAGRNTSTDRDSDSAAATSSSQHSQVSEGTNDPTLKDVMQTLQSMNSKFDGLKDDFREVKECYAGLRAEVADLKSDLSELKSENVNLKEENKRLHSRIDEITRKTDDLEDRSKRNNLIIHGIPREKNEKWQDCEDLVREMIVDKLELSGELEFDRVHRLSSKDDSPIVARCTFYKDKEAIMKAKGKLKGSTVFIGHDFSRRVREVRKKLAPHLKTAKSEKKKATMVFDHLNIDGKKFGLDHDGNLKEIT